MNNTRRSFIKNSSLIIAGTGLVPNNHVFVEDRKREKLAIQLFSVDKEMHADASATLKGLKKAGYNYVEHANYESRKFYGYNPREFRNIVLDNGLKLLSGHSVLELQHWDTLKKDFTREWYNTIDDAAKAQQQYLITPWLDTALWKDESALKHFMDVFNKCGEVCKQKGIGFGYHNHDFEFTNTFGASTVYDIILQNTDPGLVFQQMDIGNISKYDISVIRLIYQYPGRFRLMHVKDVIHLRERTNQFKSVVIGNGSLDIHSIVESARHTGGTFNFIIEYDNVNSIECAKESYAVFNKISREDKKRTPQFSPLSRNFKDCDEWDVLT